MKVIRTAAPKPQPSRPIMRLAQPAPAAPPRSGKPRASNACAAHAVRVASSPGSINPSQTPPAYDPSNLD
jgi:hypothetical protein